MGFDGLLGADSSIPRPELARRLTTDSHRGVSERGIAVAAVRAVCFDPAANQMAIYLESGDKLHVRTRYNGAPQPGVYTMRRQLSEVHDSKAFAPDRPLGGRPDRNGFVVTFHEARRATLLGVEAFELRIAPVALWPAAAPLPNGPPGPPPSPPAASPRGSNDAGVPDSAAPSKTGVDERAKVRGTDQPGTGATGTGPTPSQQSTFQVRWHGHFGKDLSAIVSIGMMVHNKKTRTNEFVPDQSVEVLDSDPTGGLAAERLSTEIITVPRRDLYTIRIEPTNLAPNDRYRTTQFEFRPKKDDSQPYVIERELAYNRNNQDSVGDVKTWKNVNPKKDTANQQRRVELLGRKVTIHEHILPRIDKTNALFADIEKKSSRLAKEIQASIFYMGAYASRTTTPGRFSNHSTGMAIDINNHDPTKQNFHFFPHDIALLTKLVQPVVKTHPQYQQFDILLTKGMGQLTASQAFNQRFPSFIARDLGRTNDADELDALTAKIGESNPFDGSDVVAAYARNELDRRVETLFASVSAKEFRAVTAAADKAKDAARATRLNLAATNWTSLRAWLLGTFVNDSTQNVKKRAVGMIALHPKLLEIMQSAGWFWGGDYENQKDYMHFEDIEGMRWISKP
jgi:D-alanyl-D-alanine carboxypeptidase-like protein